MVAHNVQPDAGIAPLVTADLQRRLQLGVRGLDPSYGAIAAASLLRVTVAVNVVLSVALLRRSRRRR